MKFKIFPYHLFWFVLSFILFTVIGTLSHEYGHIIVAKFLGYETELHYGSMNWYNSHTVQAGELYKEYQCEIENNLNFEKKQEYERYREKFQDDHFWISIGGPAQTILTGLIGLTIVFFRKKKIKPCGFQFMDWLAVFLSLFWLREVFNLVVGLASGLFSERKKYFGGDEAVISWYLDLPVGTLSIVLGVIALLISVYIIFRIVPFEKRCTFILGGFIGGISGFILWMQILGPILLP